MRSFPPAWTSTRPGVDPLKYQTPTRPTSVASIDELLTVKLRYKAPDGDESRLISSVMRNVRRTMTRESRLRVGGRGGRDAAAAVEARADGQLRVGRRARAPVQAEDPEGNRAEFVKLAELAASLARLTDARK